MTFFRLFFGGELLDTAHNLIFLSRYFVECDLCLLQEYVYGAKFAQLQRLVVRNVMTSESITDSANQTKYNRIKRCNKQKLGDIFAQTLQFADQKGRDFQALRRGKS